MLHFHKLEPYIPPIWTKGVLNAPRWRVRLGFFPTPIHKWKISQHEEIWIKRDDMTGMETSGNKIRKLEFLLADAIEKNSDCIVTIGGLQSNHCRATAVAARSLGLDSHLILRADINTIKWPDFTGNLLLNNFVDAKQYIVTHDQYRHAGSTALLEIVAERLKKQGKKPYVIPVGGSTALGTWGYIEAVRELEEQLSEAGISIDVVTSACGSGSTSTGLAIGGRLSGLWKLTTGFAVCDNERYFMDFFQEKCLSKLTNRENSKKSILDDVGEYFSIVDVKGEGYAVNTIQEIEFIKEIALLNGTVLDGVYTGKAARGLANVLSGAIPSKISQNTPLTNVLFIHTGGLSGVFSQQNERGSSTFADLFSNPSLLDFSQDELEDAKKRIQ